MKKTKKFSKGHIALAVMVAALAGAIWLNMEYTTASTEPTKDSSSKYLGQAEYVNASPQVESDEKSYFVSLKQERADSREEALSILEEALDRDDLSETERLQLLNKVEEISARAETEAGIETVLKAKGFGEAVAVIGDDGVNIIISTELNSARTAQIQDAVLSAGEFTLSDIKIICAEN